MITLAAPAQTLIIIFTKIAYNFTSFVTCITWDTTSTRAAPRGLLTVLVVSTALRFKHIRIVHLKSIIKIVMDLVFRVYINWIFLIIIFTNFILNCFLIRLFILFSWIILYNINLNLSFCFILQTIDYKLMFFLIR